MPQTAEIFHKEFFSRLWPVAKGKDVVDLYKNLTVNQVAENHKQKRRE
jgi:hypothetical protein